MNVHKNARLTPRSRAELVRRVLRDHRSMGEVAAGFHISSRTGYKWLARYRDAEELGLLDRSSRPHSSPRQTAPALALGAKILRRDRWTCAQIARALALSSATVARIVGRAGLARLGRLEAPPVPQRYEYATPGELLHVDTKKLGRIHGLGHRVTGRRHQHDGSGWEFLHVAIDDASRVAFVEVLADERRETVTGFLRRAVAWFRRHGVRVRRVLSDNGNGYRSRTFRAMCRALHLRHTRTRPYTPRTNGKAERFIQTALREWAYARPFYTSTERQALLPGWIEHYNCRRPHTALKRQPPVSRLAHGNNLMRLHN